MKALSLWQPWATLWAMGLKLNETRSRGLSHRGLLAVHAAKKWAMFQQELICTPPFREVLGQLAGIPDGASEHEYLRDVVKVLPLGAMVGQVHIADCMKITESVRRQVTGRELAFGDYTPGRIAIVANGHLKYSKPLPWRGAQGLFEIPTDAIATHLAALIDGGAS